MRASRHFRNYSATSEREAKSVGIVSVKKGPLRGTCTAYNCGFVVVQASKIINKRLQGLPSDALAAFKITYPYQD